MEPQQRITEFDLANVELAGRNLIEASAGTGKTYAISRLFLRLLLENHLSVHAILVVTFTEAATQELRDRIFRLLREARTAFIEQTSNDPLLQILLERCDTASALNDLNRALSDFDTTSIFTIHGFCRRLLYEHAFESGQTFDPEIITDQTELFTEITDDFWRMHFPDASSLFISYVLANTLSPESFADTLNAFISTPVTVIEPVPDDPVTYTAEQSFTQAFSELTTQWPEVKQDVCAIFSGGSLNGTKYKAGSIDKHITAMDALTEKCVPQPSLFKTFEKFTATYIRGAVKKGNDVPKHLFFDSCEALYNLSLRLNDLYEQRILYLKYTFYHYAKQELARRKAIKNVLYFDDLLTRVKQALRNTSGGNRLGDAVRNVYRAALIDEFQDTDPVQYTIFSTLFSGDAPLFLIGDPKQAIYSFRGADIYAYLHASRNVEQRWSLPINYRSDPALLTAVNTLFCRTGNPFAVADIAYTPVRPPTALHTTSCTLPNYDRAFTLWYTTETYTNKTAANNAIARQTAARIAEILNAGTRADARIGTKPVVPSDIAVLVRRNSEAECMQNYLNMLNVPAIIESSGSVFETQEAQDMLRLLKAVCLFKRSGCIKAALATTLFGCTANDIAMLYDNTEQWNKQIQLFTHYHALWQRYSVMRMLRTCMQNHKISERVISLPSGERRLTNLMHCAELIHAEETRVKQPMTSICTWLSSKIAADHSRVPDEEMLRLESDDNAVRIITIHRSKGLEYPIVFCPFMWGSSEFGKKRKTLPFIFHNPDADYASVLALGKQEIAQRLPIGELELLAENIRLLYVAVTRAQYRCFCVWGNLPGSDTSALAYLLFGRTMPEISVAGLKAAVAAQSHEALLNNLERIAEDSQGTIAVEPLPDTPVASFTPSTDAALNLSLRSFNGSIPQPWTVASFTGLSSHHATQTDYDGEDYDAATIVSVSEESTENTEEDLFGFPKGADAGLFFHDMLEHLDFTKVDSDQTTALIESTLFAHGFEALWTKPIRTMLEALVASSLHPADPSFRLLTAGNDRCMRETEFYFPLRTITPNDLNEFTALPNTGPDDGVTTLDFSPAQGYMKGIMDLVVYHNNKAYLIDWKSNFLGNTFGDYAKESLAAAMEKERYTLQYRLYLAALHRYLELRIQNYHYDTHFGGVAYVFLRGISAQHPGCGIYNDRPSLSYVESLCTKLMVC